MRKIQNKKLLLLLNKLRKAKKPFWKRVKELLEKPRRQRVEVNLYKIEKYGEEGGTVVVPGKVLGTGSLSKRIRVAAFSFSKAAKEGIEKAGGKAVSIEDLLKEPEKNVSEFKILV